MINMKVSKLLKMRKMYLTKNKIKKENNMLFIDIVAMIELLRKTMNTIDDHITNIDDAKINIIINEDKPINELTLSDIKRLSIYIDNKKNKYSYISNLYISGGKDQIDIEYTDNKTNKGKYYSPCSFGCMGSKLHGDTDMVAYYYNNTFGLPWATASNYYKRV